MSIENFTDIHSTNRIGLHEKKLNGELPINRLELLYLVNSWEKNKDFKLDVAIERGYIPIECSEKKCYDLSKLDTSEITDMSQLFYYSEFNGDISNWDVSKVTNMNMRAMFCLAKDFNQNLNNWNVLKVTNMSEMFYNTNFNQVLNNWDVSNVTDMYGMFDKAIAFEKRFNNGKTLPKDTDNLKIWFNSDMMLAIDIKEREKDNLDSFYNNLVSVYNNLDKENRN